MNIEIADRIAKGNKAYYANAKLIKSKFLKKKPQNENILNDDKTSRSVFMGDLDCNSKM